MTRRQQEIQEVLDQLAMIERRLLPDVTDDESRVDKKIIDELRYQLQQMEELEEFVKEIDPLLADPKKVFPFLASYVWRKVADIEAEVAEEAKDAGTF
jgi:hypothetical protein